MNNCILDKGKEEEETESN